MTRARDLSKFANSQAFSIDSDFQVGINSTVPAATLDVRGDSVITGVLTATSFSGTVDATGLTGTPDITVNNIVGAAATFSGVVTYEDVTNVDSVGVITARSDVNIADSIIHLGDTNTKIRFPANDTITFETAGNERFRIESDGGTIASNNLTLDEDGRLMLGTTTEGEGNADDLTIATSGHTGMTIRSGTSNRGNIYFSDGTSGDAEYRGYVTYDHDGDKLKIGTANYDRLIIDSSGNVAIGTATAGGTLHVENSGELNAFFEGSASTLGARILLKNNNNTANAYNDIEGADAGGQGTSAIRFINVNDGNNEGALALRTRASGGSMSERMRIHGSGYVTLDGDTDFSNIQFKANGTVRGYVGPAGFLGGSDNDFGLRAEGGNTVFYVSSAEKMRLDSSGRLLIGTTTEGNGNANNLTIGDAGSTTGITLRSANDGHANIFFSDAHAGSGELVGYIQYGHSDNYLSLATNNAEVMRLDSSARLLVGSTSAETSFRTPKVQIKGSDNNTGLLIHNTNSTADGASIIFAHSRGTGTVNSGDLLGDLVWCANDGTDIQTRAAYIRAAVDGAPGSNDMPGRMQFYVTADGSSSPTERMRITNEGYITNKSSYIDNLPAEGFTLTDHRITITGETTSTTTTAALRINRDTHDGELVEFNQDSSKEGTISVSGSTVSYNGGHLSRWSQTLTTDEHTGLLKGTVMTNLDEMCQWVLEARDEVLWTEEDRLPEGVSVGDVRFPARAAGFEDNEQLNKMAVSSVEGDPNVAGAFVNIDSDGDLNVAMTGDMVIRIAQGTTVARGDLLMSAGDGTAKPQDDDIVRSKTIAKVTSTTKSITYSDGSYCVPCVLMAC